MQHLGTIKNQKASQSNPDLMKSNHSDNSKMPPDLRNLYELVMQYSSLSKFKISLYQLKKTVYNDMSL